MLNKVKQTILLRQEHPDWPLEKIAQTLGIKRPSVWETLKRYTIKTISIKIPKGCIVCFKPAKFRSKYCSTLCRRKHVSFLTRCAFCGIITFKIPWKVKRYFLKGRLQKRFYCSRLHFLLDKQRKV